ncbi:MAG TPA: hypothetical protein EYP78_03710 [Candidatus Omnitrophica bacterium]|nr:hypothetical protein [Candidatus Omnitrophota bacterium]
MKKVGIEVSKAKIGVYTNSPNLLERDRFYWLDTNFFSVRLIPFEEATDSFLEIEDRTVRFSMEIRNDSLLLKGNFSNLEKSAKDRRYGIFGNLGIFSSWVLRTLEKVHDIYTFHACGIVKDNQLMIIPGGAGSGKTIFILSALKKGWEVFSTEFIHFRVRESVEFFKGSLKDGVRLSTLRDHFPKMAEKLGITLKEEIGGKLVVDFSPFQVESDTLQNFEITLVFPHVEERKEQVIHQEVTDREFILRNLFNNASEKICKSILLYGEIGIPGLDTIELANKRIRALNLFLELGRIKQSFIWVSGVREVEGIL